MKKMMIIIVIVLCLGCEHNQDLFYEIDDTEIINAETRATQTNIFNWEKGQKVNLIGYSNDIILPWYNGASSQLPFFILENYKKEDGWEMFYNFCSDKNEVQVGRYYLMFYNIFTGVMRVFYYNTGNVNAATTTMWSTELDKSSSLLNATGYFADPISKPRNNPKVYVSNITSHSAKALTKSWNCFDIEFAYDSNFDRNRNNLHMSIGGYDVSTSNIRLKGVISLNSEGTIIGTTSGGTPQQSIANSALSSVGSSALTLIKNKAISDGNKSFFPNLGASAISSIASGGVSEILKYGVNLAFGSFLAKGAKSQTTTSTINLKTNGTLEIAGEINTNISANVSGITNLLMPGANPIVSDRVQPAYNKSFGVWNLAKEPIIRHAYETVYINYPSSNGQFMGNKWEVQQYYYTLPQYDNVKINPAILDKIEKYTVDTEVVFYEKFQGGNGLEKVVRYPSNDGNPSLYIKPFLVDRTTGSETIMYRSATHLDFTGGKGYVDLPRGFTPWSKNNEKAIVYCDEGRPPSDDLAIKVTVTIYPKAPYNSIPIVSTRTYLPKMESIKGFYDYMKEW